MITRNFNLYLNAGHSVPLVINVNQYDSGEQWVFTLYNSDGTQYTPSTGAIVGIKSDGLGIINSGSVVDGKVVISETSQMTAAVGKAVFELLIDSQTHGTANFVVLVEKRPGDNADMSESDLSLLQEAIDSTSETHIFAAVQEWMDENLDTSSVVDQTLSISGAAADAKAAGDAIRANSTSINELSADVNQIESDLSTVSTTANSAANEAHTALLTANGKASITANQDGTLAVTYAPLQLADVPTMAHIGDMDTLATTQKGTIVSAINETYNRTRLFIESSEISEVLEG